MWLCDKLPKDLPTTRIIIYGYDSELVGSDSFQDLEALGTGLRTLISSIRPRSPTTAVSNTMHCYLFEANKELEKRKPLFFIAHSLGGLVVKQVFYGSELYVLHY
jgi:hypothetical protein